MKANTILEICRKTQCIRSNLGFKHIKPKNTIYGLVCIIKSLAMAITSLDFINREYHR